MIAGDPYADLTDLYAFVSADKSDSVTFIMNAIPYQDPMGGPNYYKFDPNVRYVLHVAQSGHNVADVNYVVEFQTTIKNPNTFLYNTGPYAKDGDDNLNVQQTATVTKQVRGGGETVVGTNLPVQPANIGPHSNPVQIGGQDTTNSASGVSGHTQRSLSRSGQMKARTQKASAAPAMPPSAKRAGPGHDKRSGEINHRIRTREAAVTRAR